MNKTILLILGLTLIIACEKDDNIETLSDDKLLELAYSKDYFYSEDFYFEKDLDGYVYYENTVSIKPTAERESIWIELSTNEKPQAKKWSDLSNDYSSVNRELILENETKKYYEFKRVNVENENDILLSRVHKSDYFISLYDRFTEIDTIGIYNGEVTTSEIKELIEYLWSCGTLGFTYKVVESRITDKDDSFEQYIQSLKIVYGDWGLNDWIYVYDNTFSFNKSTKLLTIKTELIKEIQGDYNEGW